MTSPEIFILDVDSDTFDFKMGSNCGMALDDGKHHPLIFLFLLVE
jgi:hypothetical protein